MPVHLYVAYGWVDGYFDGAEVNHKDFDRENYHASNLEWVTHKENIQKSVEGNYDIICKSKQGTNNGRKAYKTQRHVILSDRNKVEGVEGSNPFVVS